MFFQDYFRNPLYFIANQTGCVICKDVSVLEKNNGSRTLNLLITEVIIFLFFLMSLRLTKLVRWNNNASPCPMTLMRSRLFEIYMMLFNSNICAFIPVFERAIVHYLISIFIEDKYHRRLSFSAITMVPKIEINKLTYRWSLVWRNNTTQTHKIIKLVEFLHLLKNHWLKIKLKHKNKPQKFQLIYDLWWFRIGTT